MGLFKFTPERMVLYPVQDTHLAKIRSFVQQKTGVELSDGDASTVNMRGWDVTWSYNRPACELTIIVNSKPKWPPMKFVRAAIREELAKHGVTEVEK